MYDEDIVEPIPCPQAFAQGGELATYSQAALLLAVGIAVKPEYERLLATLVESQPFALPELRPIVDRVPEEYFAKVLDRNAHESRGLPANELRRVAAENLYRNPREHGDVDGILRLLAASLVSSDELVRVAAAVSTMDLVDASTAAFRTLVIAAVRSRSELVRATAISALARLEYRLGGWQGRVWQWYRRVWELFSRGRSSALPSMPMSAPAADATCIVNGTVFSPVGGRIEEWWKPGTGDFHEYLRTGPRPNVYSGPDYYYWGGAWNDLARTEAAQKLASWVGARSFAELDIFAHSHGGNVAMQASHDVKVRKLILMSCPVHWGVYQPDFSKVNTVVSIRIKWDLVIMADRGDQRFHDSRIEEHILPVWYGSHSSSRRSSTWRSRGLADDVGVDRDAPTRAPASEPRPVRRVTTFDYFVWVKGPLTLATALASAIETLPEVRHAWIEPVVFKKTPPRPEYSIHVIASGALTESRIRSLATRVNAEFLSFQPAPWAGPHHASNMPT